MFPNNVINFTPTRIINLGILRLARLSHWNINISYYSKMINAELWHDFNTKMYIQGGQEKLTLLTNNWYYGVNLSGPLCKSRSKISGDTKESKLGSKNNFQCCASNVETSFLSRPALFQPEMIKNLGEIKVF